jgi:hypothetical protein
MHLTHLIEIFHPGFQEAAETELDEITRQLPYRLDRNQVGRTPEANL